MNLRTASIGATALLTLASTALATHSSPSLHQQDRQDRQDRRQDRDGRRGLVAVYPWSFQNGDPTSRKTAIETADEIARKAGYTTVDRDSARTAWNNHHSGKPGWGSKPSPRALEEFGKEVGAAYVMYGSITWNSRSLWVSLGPKTISTATADVYVFDVNANRVVYSKTRVAGRSDEKENGLKVVADVLITPLVTMVSGGPKTPHEQRAVQIALGRGYRGWVRENVAAN